MTTQLPRRRFAGIYCAGIYLGGSWHCKVRYAAVPSVQGQAVINFSDDSLGFRLARRAS